jgi:hypothetical protein
MRVFYAPDRRSETTNVGARVGDTRQGMPAGSRRGQIMPPRARHVACKLVGHAAGAAPPGRRPRKMGSAISTVDAGCCRSAWHPMANPRWNSRAVAGRRA